MKLGIPIGNIKNLIDYTEAKMTDSPNRHVSNLDGKFDSYITLNTKIKIDNIINKFMDEHNLNENIIFGTDTYQSTSGSDLAKIRFSFNKYKSYSINLPETNKSVEICVRTINIYQIDDRYTVHLVIESIKYILNDLDYMIVDKKYSESDNKNNICTKSNCQLATLKKVYKPYLDKLKSKNQAIPVIEL
jgi:hypothetical protein